tara:strand:+ start:274 stop:2352 length:2079 start_codon:yes stop_codon:yes gene_type:complete
MQKSNIFIILPFKESLNQNFAGAVSIYVQDTVKYSTYKKNIKIISSDGKNKSIFRNKKYILDFCNKYNNQEIDIIEIHNRPEYVKYIKKYFPNTKIVLTFHNDPLTLRGSTKLNERELLLNQCSKIVFISRWVQNKYFKSFKNSNFINTDIIYNGIKKLKKKYSKKKDILFVGKLNHAKGYSIYVDAAKKFKEYDKTWNFIAIGDEPRKKIFPDRKIVKEIGYKTNKEILKYYGNSEIAVGNSVWDEPFGRVALEASSRQCLPIISNIAGLTESKKIGYVLKENNSEELFKILKKLTNSTLLRRQLQLKYFNNNKFDIKKISKSIDNIRSSILNKNIRKKPNKNLKILHIANFNELSDGRLFYSFANKLNNGFVKDKHIVHTLSDRLYLKKNKSLFHPFTNFSNYTNFNNKIINTIINFTPDLIIFGHVFNIENRIFDYCKSNNILTANWFIDSISKDFLNRKKKLNFINLVNKVDKSFITSSPDYFKNNKIFKKLHFIPNPVDSAIDNNRNYRNNNLEYDIFIAISHGQNRAILKKGKNDERENIFSYAIKHLNQFKFASFGINNTEPIWGSNFFYHLKRSKIALNISRGSYQKMYSSDRLSSLMGNGLLVFLENKTGLTKMFKNNKDAVFFKTKVDLIKKINFFLKNDKLRKNIARSGCIKYHKKYSNLHVARYILSKLKLNNHKISWFK